jgi:hypothetical protein
VSVLSLTGVDQYISLILSRFPIKWVGRGGGGDLFFRWKKISKFLSDVAQRNNKFERSSVDQIQQLSDHVRFRLFSKIPRNRELPLENVVCHFSHVR